MEINYSGKSALIVDSKLEDLGALRQILSRLGVDQVQVASSVNMALSLMREFTYDLCFALYDMGKSEKNGLQLLHEANHEQILPSSCVFFLIVDPETSELLFGSLENSPDTYISKPFDQAKIRHRVEKQLRIKEVIKPVETLMDAGEYEQALEQSQQVAHNYPGLNIYLQRINGIAFLKMGRYSLARDLFVSLTQNRELPWADVGKGIAHFHLGEYDAALSNLNRVIDQQHFSVEAYTWLSRIYRVRGELGRAVALMRKAVMIQPTVPALQSELADLACQTGEWEIAKSAFQQAIRYARYSIFQSPDHYFGLTRALIQSSANRLSEVEGAVIRVLEDVVLDFPDDQEVMFRAKLINCDLYRQESMRARLEQMLQQTWNFFLRMAQDAQCKWLDVMVDAAHGSGLDAEVQDTRRELARKVVEREWGKANYMAMASFRKGDLDQAFEMFKQAHLLAPGHVGISLNLIQTGIEKAKRGSDTLWSILLVRDVLVSIPFASLPDKQQQRFSSLQERFVNYYRELRGEHTDPGGQEL